MQFSIVRRSLRFAAVLSLGLTAIQSGADEGMWLYNMPPKSQVRARYGFEITDPWLEHLQKSSVRFNSGGSGSFISEEGLVISNHHVGADAIQKLSTDKANLLRDGFLARNRAGEIPCKDLELNVLQAIEDVTSQVTAAVPANASPEDAFAARRKVIARIEDEAQKRTGLRCDVVTLFQGGQYHLYQFKRHTDVRLVFAPEQQAAFFGGDPDNFEFPRFDLDVCIFRVYENGVPFRPQHFLKWSAAGVSDGELTFVSGHPGRTSRLLTVAELEYLRDHQIPAILAHLKRREVLLANWGARHSENLRRAKDDLFGIQNSRKARDGALAGLQSAAIMEAKQKAEAAFRARLAARPELADALGALDRIAAAQRAVIPKAPRYRMLETGWGFQSSSFEIARTLLRHADEKGKPNGERLEEFRDSSRPSLELELFSEKPIHDDLEIVSLGDSLTSLTETLGYGDPTVRGVLAGKSPRDRAAELIRSTRTRDVAWRKQMYQAGPDALPSARDPMVELARLVDSEARELRKFVEAQKEIRDQGHAALSRARLALDGAQGAPDATFTLRLSYGVVKGFEDDGKMIPSMTTLAGMFERNAAQKNQPPFDLPERWLKKKRSLQLSTPFNFIGTHDIIGGNSGSPVVNRAGEFVGIIFDGNLPSLVLDFAYEDVKARALSVDSRAIIECLNRVYGARELAHEITGKR